MPRNIIAIDPGASGGIAWSTDDAVLSAACSMPDTDGDITEALRHIVQGATGQVSVYMEKVGGHTGGRPQPGSRMFEFGDSNGFIRGVLTALGCRIVLVTPQTWQKTLQLGITGIEKDDNDNQRAAKKRAWKNKLKEEAQRRNPHIKVTLATADALLILEHALQAERT